ncbi:MAG: hypothetical protein P1P65_08985 [Treponema sp.]
MMRKAYLLLTICTLAFVFLSCKQGIFDQDAVQTAGTVYLNVGGQQGRAVDSEGLPVLKDAQMDLKIVSPGKSETVILPAGAEKTWSGTFPVGEELTITVTVRTAAAQWRGSARHKVTSGVNTVSIKLKKSAAALNSLLFGTDKSHAGGHHDYTLTLKIGSKEIKKENIRYHNFCRDNKGRTYLAYQEGNDYKLERYTSEGDKEDKTFTLPEYSYGVILASDHTTGKVYLAAVVSLPGGHPARKLFRINENGGSLTELTGITLGFIESCAVHNDVFVTLGYEGTTKKLKMYRINGDTFSEITLSAPQPNLSEDTKIMLGNSLTPYVRINDLYLTSDALYVLFSAFDNNSNNSSKYYSLGGIVKYSYTAQDTSGTISNPKRIGIKDSHTADVHGIYATDESTSFYGPVKVIGFDAENLYIADDGVRFEYQNGRVRITENKNRTATLKKTGDVLIFEDRDTAEWLTMETAWITPVANPLVFFSLDKNNGNTLDKLILSNDVSGSASIDVASNIELDTDNYRNIFYTFDRDNNFYLVTKDKLKKLKKSDGSYTEDSGFNGVYNFESSTEAPQNPAYDIVDEVLYAIGKASSGTEVLMKYDGGSWIGTSPSIDIDAEHLYTVYGGTVYSSAPHEAEININQIGSSPPHKEVKFPSETDYKNVYGIFVADDFCYVLLHTRDNKQAAIAYFDVTKIDELSSPGPFPTVPVSQMKELSIEGLTKFENIKFTGYRDGKLYIAVDGIKRSAVEGAPKLENINKTVSFNTSAKTFDSPVNVPDGITWFREENKWHGTKTLVWKKGQYGIFSYYQLNSANDPLPSETFKPGNSTEGINNYLTDVFCYDEEGNLYIVKRYNTTNYQVCRFALKDDGSYNTTPVIARLYESSHNSLSYKPSAIAVDTSGNVSSGKNVLYYSYGDRNCFIKRIEWSGDSFTSASFNNSWEIEGPQSTDDYTSFTSIAANQDGLFVGEYDYNDAASKYTIRVKKYLHNATGYDNSSGTVTIAGGETYVGDTIQESLNALYIQDGVLYGLTTKTKKEQDPDSGNTILFAQSGRLFKVGDTSSFSSGNAVKLYGDDGVMDTSDGNFAPYRFIAVKPKKLVIASDGAYGKKNTQDAENKNKVWIFTPDSSGVYNQSSSVDTHGDVKFSKELKWDTGCGFLWE